MSDFMEFIRTLNSRSDEELRSLNHMVVSELRHRQDLKIMSVKSALRVGDKVWFNSKRGGRVSGTITRFKQKTVEVKTGFGLWTVTATLLHKDA